VECLTTEPVEPNEVTTAPDPTLYQGCWPKMRLGPLKGLWVSIRKVESQQVTAELLPRGVFGHLTHFHSLRRSEPMIGDRHTNDSICQGRSSRPFMAMSEWLYWWMGWL
jgi:hypothetical protein